MTNMCASLNFCFCSISTTRAAVDAAAVSTQLLGTDFCRPCGLLTSVLLVRVSTPSYCQGPGAVLTAAVVSGWPPASQHHSCVELALCRSIAFPMFP